MTLIYMFVSWYWSYLHQKPSSLYYRQLIIAPIKKSQTSLFPGAQQDTLYGFDHIKTPKLWEDIGNISRAIMQIVTFVGMLVD